MTTKVVTSTDIDNKTIVINSDSKLEVAYTANALIGAGRPDKPETTNGVVKGTEHDGMMYQSTDGAGVGAYLWQRVNGKWVVIYGDTGLVTVKNTKSLKAGAYIKFQRINNTVYCFMGGLSFDLFGYAGKTEKGFYSRQPARIEVIGQGGIPEGFRASVSLSFQLFDDDTNKPVAGVYVGGVKDANFMRFTPYKEGATGKPSNDWIPDVGPANLRPQAMAWTTDDPFPTRLP
jgi:hypothetical protein